MFIENRRVTQTPLIMLSQRRVCTMSKKYKLNELNEAYEETYKFKSEYLAKTTREILERRKLSSMLPDYSYRIGELLEPIREDRDFWPDFDSFDEYTQKMFGWNKGTAARFIQIKNQFYTKDGKQFMEEERGWIFGYGQLTKLKSFNGKNTTIGEAVEFVKTHGITPDTTTDEIDEIVKAYKSSKKSSYKLIQPNQNMKNSAKGVRNMKFDKDFRVTLNEFYQALTEKTQTLMKTLMPLVDTTLLMSMSYVIKHYIRNMYKHKEPTPDNAAQYSDDNYPIPVIRLSDLCEVEIYTDVISVFTRLKYDRVQKLDFSRLAGYDFEVYGYDGGQLIDFSDGDTTVQETKDNILNSNTEVADFYFDFPFDCGEDEILTLVTLLHDEGFFF